MKLAAQYGAIANIASDQFIDGFYNRVGNNKRFLQQNLEIWQ